MYTNGFDINVVLPALKKRLGWRQPTAVGSPVLSSENKASESKRYFDSFHAMCSLKNIKAVQEDEEIDDYELNAFLSNMQDDAIMRCLNEVFRTPELIEQKLMYTRFGTMDRSLDNQNMAVGYIINIANDFNISTQIKSATLYFDKDCSFNLYLFMDGIKPHIKRIPVSCKAYERTVVEFIESDDEEIQDTSLILNYKIGRKFYLCYFQNELGDARAIREQVDTWATTHCFEAYTFQAPLIDNNTDFNHNYRQYNALPSGLNLEIISFRDHTQKIIRQANLFDEAQGLTVASMVLEMITTTSRSNITERQGKNIADRLYMDMNQAYATQDAPITPGLKSRLYSEYKKLRETFYPSPKPDSVNIQGDRYGIDQAWYDQNYRQITNPPIIKT